MRREGGSERLGALVRDAIDGDDPRDAEQRQRFLAQLTRPSKRPVRALGLAAAAVAVVVGLLAWPEPALEYEVQGARTNAQGFIRAEARPVVIGFSDGSKVRLTPGSAARLVEVEARGARILLERGEAEVAVEPEEDARWSVSAGPYAVAVTGTRFSVSWSPERGRFEVQLEEGSVAVRGPLAGDGLRLAPGQRLVADDRDLRVRASTDDDVQGPSSAAAAETSAPDEAPEAPSPEDASQADAGAPADADGRPQRPPRSWARMVADGDASAVLAQARARGLGSVLSSGSAGELVALSDAARYEGETALARKTLEALRDRFAGSSAAATAAFLLGRMNESAPSAAIAWYDRYLAEAPSGAYAEQALGRKVVLSKDPRVARRYLERHPEGSYAEHARAIVK